MQKVVLVQAVTFLETRWVHPAIVSARRSRIGLTRVVTVDTRIGDSAYQVHFDATTYLPVRVVASTPTELPQYINNHECRLSAYQDVSGLQLPHEVTETGEYMIGAFKQRIQYQVNVDYDERIFETPPSLARGRKGWQRPSSSQ